MNEIALEPGETITRAVRKHWFFLAASLLPLMLLAWLPVPLMDFLSKMSQLGPGTIQLGFISFDNPLVRLLYGLWLLVLWSASFNIVTWYYLNEWIITTTRIIEIHQYGYFSREVSSLLLARVQDVNTNVDGLFGTLLDYGRLEVQSAGQEEHFTMSNIPDPGELRDLIMREIATLHLDGRIPSPSSGTMSGV
jgi:hypothetical protein